MWWSGCWEKDDDYLESRLFNNSFQTVEIRFLSGVTFKKNNVTEKTVFRVPIIFL